MTQKIFSPSSYFRPATGVAVVFFLASVLLPAAPAAGAPEVDVLDRTPAGVKTLVVSPVVGSPQASGKSLIGAFKAIALNKLRGVSVRKWLIELEPGVYDIGDFVIKLEPGVEIEGAGVEATEIVGTGQTFNGPDFSFHKGVIVGSDDSELRNLTVRCVNSAQRDACITMVNVGASPRLTDVRLIAVDPQGLGHWGLRNDHSSPRLQDVEIVVANGLNNYGMVNVFADSRPDVRDTVITAIDGSGDNIGMLNKVEALPAFMKGVEIGTMGGARAFGIWSIETERLEVEDKGFELDTLEMIDVEISALDARSAVGILHGRFALDMKSSLVLADGSAIDLDTFGDARVTASELHASRYFVRAINVDIVSTSLAGEGAVAAYGDRQCTAVTVNDAGPLNSCP